MAVPAAVHRIDYEIIDPYVPKVHEKAVKIRKMTDEQLVQYVNDRVEKARSEGFNQGKKSVTGITVNEFLKEISKIKGVGDATICKIMEHFREKGIKD